MPLYVLYACLKTLYHLLVSAFPNIETFGMEGGKREKDNIKTTE